MELYAYEMTQQQLPEAWVSEVERLYEDFGVYAPSVLMIATKEGGLKPFRLNTAQRYLHERIEQQLFEEEQVRVLVLKGRQQGISTYVEGRFYWKTQFRHGVKAYILTHLQEATDNLFSMVERYHNNVPEEIRPSTSKESAKELLFDGLDSGYKVGTAGSKGAGRSSTVHYFHGSEVAFWPNADRHAAGVLQAVPKRNNSEVILESTANGVGGYFHELWKKAEKGVSEFIAVFIPWFWQEEYRANPPTMWEPTGEEQQYADWYGLDRKQTYWMYLKNIELGGNPGLICTLFKQEYPSNAAEAFQMSGHDSIIESANVMNARKNVIENPYGARVMGVDPARYGDDRTSLIDRKGRKAYNLQSYHKKSTMETVGYVAERIRLAEAEGDPYQAVFVDVVGLGAGVVDRLKELGYADLIKPVNAGARPNVPERYMNKRVEMWHQAALWLKSDEGVDIPDSDSLHADLIAPAYSFNSRQQMVLQTKEDMRKDGIPSPDEAEALILTFAYQVRSEGAQRVRALQSIRRSDWRTA